MTFMPFNPLLCDELDLAWYDGFNLPQFRTVEVKDIRILFNIETSQIYITYLIVSTLVAALTLLLIRIFKPFIEIYLLHYSRYFFNVLVCLLSLSSVYIVLRVYGYSRLSLIVYLFISSLFLTYSGKFLNFGKN